MSSAGTREKKTSLYIDVPSMTTKNGSPTVSRVGLAAGKQKTVSESHRINPNTGNYDAGGPFYTSRVSYFVNPGHVKDAYWSSQGLYYTGPTLGNFPTSSDMTAVGFQNPGLLYGSSNEESMKGLGTTAISQSAPINPASNLGTTLAEIHREGIPSLPGIKLWKGRTQAAKAAGSEYLNAEFGWLPLVDEVHNVSSAARHSRDVMNQYHHGEGRDTHRTFYFPSSRSTGSAVIGNAYPLLIGADVHMIAPGLTSVRKISLVRETKRWFKGCYTYALPSSTDSWRRHMGFGSQADQLFGLTLTPDVLWELTPWSWAVDWFSNAGDVINNVTNFGAAGLVLRYGYMMEETIESITAEQSKQSWYTKDKVSGTFGETLSEPSNCGIECVTKRRVPASPFGFSIGWEGLSPTQLAITAALGITRLL